MSISQQDLTVRLQLTGCAYSKLANEFADNLKYGRKCAIDNEKTLLLLNAYIELIECYKLDTTIVSTNTTASFNIADYMDGGAALLSTVQFVFDGVVVGGAYAVLSELDLLHIVDQLNLLQSDYVVALTGSGIFKPTIFTFTGSCSTTIPISVILSYGERSELLPLTLTLGECESGGIKKYNNCISEVQLLSIFDKISKITGVCFQPLGFTYTPVLGKPIRRPAPGIIGGTIRTHL
jgi:hypothetical protein